LGNTAGLLLWFEQLTEMGPKLQKHKKRNGFAIII